MDSYDEIPYESSPFSETHPDHIAPLVRLFGVEAADPAGCRLLEIGCAGGGNLIPMAIDLPGSRFLGIELSPRQAEEGAQLARRLGLGNIQIRQGDITQLSEPGEGFDYIIAHGIYSWVPAQVREEMLAVIRAHLSPRGAAYISYNSLPGWRWRGILRDMLLFHTRDARTPGARLERAFEFLDFVERGMAVGDSLNARFLRQELRRIRNNHPSYLYHEYLESDNHPFLFSQFVADAGRHGLRYVCDTELHAMFTQSLGDGIGDWVEQQGGDMVALWQYLDFAVNRNFRQSLLCRDDLNPRFEIDLGRFAGYSFFTNLRPPKKIDLRRGKGVEFIRPDDERHPVEHPLTQAALLLLIERYPDAVPLDELTAAAQRRLAQAGNPRQAEEVDSMQSELFALYSHQVVGARLRPSVSPPANREAPCLTALAREQLAMGMTQLSAAHHAVIKLDPFGHRVAALCDGSRSPEEIVSEMIGIMTLDPELAALLTPGQRNHPERLRQAVTEGCQRMIALFGRNGLLLPQ